MDGMEQKKRGKKVLLTVVTIVLLAVDLISEKGMICLLYTSDAADD